MTNFLQRLLLYQLIFLIVPIAYATPSDIVIYPGEAYIQSANYSGTGCPIGSTDFIFQEGANEFSVSFKHFKVDNDANYSSSYCQLKFTIVAPPGVAYRLNSLTYKGHATLDQSGMATIANNSRLQSITPINKSTQYVYGSLDNTTEQYFQQTTLTDHLQNWSACNRHAPLEIKTEVSLNSKDQQSTITIKSINGKILFSRKHCSSRLNAKSI
ncbi:DUF4360 domain-containing protein [Spartinivicinus poritis]|uniref:DUF4360 domain-containing protein n=1 Tax=Spartinivicinus poritis TaxID=2994640 RepID=A0ABT5UFI1_9GAMM|nr:DUF4360 domain-containing protein [Spartinivicinus sp. A2-2]MDE1465144.1 DUF4360 domain-containing protein [Spartinivicinus sp. A2-2]